MTYIPTSTSGTGSPQKASRRAVDLSERLSQVIGLFLFLLTLGLFVLGA